jgi:hypothetical protein
MSTTAGPDGDWKPGVQAGLQRSLPEAPCLRASMSYRWVPPGIDYDDDARAWLNLECVAKVHDGIKLTFFFEDELGWQFDEAWRQAFRCVESAITGHRRRPPPNLQPYRARMPTADRRHFSPPRPHERRDHPEFQSPEGYLLGVLSGRLTPAERLAWLEAATNARKALHMADIGQPSAGLPYADAAVRIVDVSSFRFVRGFLHLALGDTIRAKEDFDKALTNNLRSPSAYRGLAAAYHREGQLQKALAYCNSSLVWGLADGCLHELRGIINHDLRNYGSAVEDYHEARRLLGPDYPQRLDALIMQAENEVARVTPLST